MKLYFNDTEVPVIWAYTRLGKMNIPEGDVIELLSNGDITLKIAIAK